MGQWTLHIKEEKTEFEKVVYVGTLSECQVFLAQKVRQLAADADMLFMQYRGQHVYRENLGLIGHTAYWNSSEATHSFVIKDYKAR